MSKELKMLDDIFDKVSENIPLAIEALSEFRTSYNLKKNKVLSAKADLLSIIIAATNNTFEQLKIDDKKLLAWFRKEEMHNDAARLLIAKAKHFLNRGNIRAGEACLDKIKKEHIPGISAATEISYMYYLAQLCATKGEFAQRLAIASEALEKLKAIQEKNSWWHGTYTTLCCAIADVYQRNGQPDEAWPYLQQALAISKTQRISNQHTFHIYRHLGLHFNFKSETENSIHWYQQALALLKENENLPYLIVINSNLAFQLYWLYQETPVTQKAKRADIIVQMQKHADAIEKYNSGLSSTVHGANLLLTRSRICLLKKEYSKALKLLNATLPIYIKENQGRSIVEYYQLGHKIYYEWGMQTKDHKKLQKAYSFLLKYNNIVKEDSKKTTEKKLNAVKMSYDLKQQKLTRQLMQQKIDALNNDLQMTSLNLHDKILVLDELKSHIKTLANKGLQINQLSKSILQKIESVKITDQDKNRLKEKLHKSNEYLGKVLSEKFPSLTSLEISMCSLFRTGITNKELAKLYGQTEKSYELHRYRIKRKMKLGAKDNLVKHLVSIDNPEKVN